MTKYCSEHQCHVCLCTFGDFIWGAWWEVELLGLRVNRIIDSLYNSQLLSEMAVGLLSHCQCIRVTYGIVATQFCQIQKFFAYLLYVSLSFWFPNCYQSCVCIFSNVH